MPPVAPKSRGQIEKGWQEGGVRSLIKGALGFLASWEARTPPPPLLASSPGPSQ